MNSSSHALSRRLAARDALHVAEFAHSVGKYAVAATLCHLAVNHALRSAFAARRKAKRGSGGDLSGLVDGFVDDCSAEQRTLLTRLGTVAAAWSGDPQSAATLATRGNSERWVRDTDRLVQSLLS